MEKEERKTAAGLLLWVHYLDLDARKFWPADSEDVADLFAAIRRTFSVASTTKLIVQTKDGTDKLHLLDKPELELTDALKCDSGGKYRVYVEVPKVEAAGTGTKDWHKDLQELKGEFSQMIRTLMTGAAKGFPPRQSSFDQCL